MCFRKQIVPFGVAGDPLSSNQVEFMKFFQ